MRKFSVLLASILFLTLSSGGPVQFAAPAIYLVDPTTATCRANDRPCQDWLRFRRLPSGPYQAFAVAAHPDRATVIISEPFAPRAELLALIDAVFGPSLVERTYRRWATGLDGWLEDLVLDVRLNNARTATVISGHDLAAWEAPAQIVERLLFIYGALYGTVEGLSIDNVEAFPEQRVTPTVPEPRVAAADLLDWLNETPHPWREISGKSDPVTFHAMQSLRQPSVHLRDDGSLVSLAIPPQTALSALAEPFRRFAVSSDLLLGAYRVTNGTTFLVARARQVPLTTLPPLRFETLASFIRYRTTELAQSYERQRIFAGRVQKGPFGGWDWAPILLSSQLDDSEFGTLLNQADQILKSWSQAGAVDYYAFAHGKPSTFPFGSTAASDYFARSLGTTSLVFNWNTEAFSTIHQIDQGEVLSVDRYGALPILYLPAGSLADGIPANESDKVDELRRLLKGVQARRTESVSKAAAATAREYFAGRGDPILMRVAQNVLLFHIAQAFLESVVTTHPAAPPARWESVSRVLRDEARAWLQRVAAKGATTGMSATAEAALERVVKDSTLTIDQIAEALATPQVTAARLATVGARYQRSRERQLSLLDRHDEARNAYRTAFTDFCTSVAGTIETDATGRRECKYRESTYRSGSLARARLDAAESQMTAISQEFTQVRQELERSGPQLRELARAYAKADALAKTLAREASFTTELDRILEGVRAALAGEPVASIRTPVLVLSRNAKDEAVIGGHNIAFEPTRIRMPSVGNIAPAVKRNPAVARATIRPPGMAPAPDAAAALKSTRSGSLVEEMRSVLNRSIDDTIAADLTRQAAGCACDALVVRTGEGEIFFVRNSPPPVRRQLLGTSAIVDALAGPPKASVVRFDGFSEAPHVVESVARSVQLAGEVTAAEGNTLKRLTDVAARWFGRSEPSAPKLFSYSRGGGPPEILRVFGDGAVGDMLNHRVSWRTATVTAGDVGTSASGMPATSTYVRFGARPGRPVTIESVRVEVAMTAEHKALAPQQVQTLVRTTLAATTPTGTANVADGVLVLRQAIQKQMTPVEINFFLHSGDTPVRVTELRSSSSKASAGH